MMTLYLDTDNEAPIRRLFDSWLDLAKAQLPADEVPVAPGFLESIGFDDVVWHEGRVNATLNGIRYIGLRQVPDLPPTDATTFNVTFNYDSFEVTK